MGAVEFQGITVPAVLYVNDDSTTGDVFCSAPGSDANYGFWPDMPMRRVQALLNKYPSLALGTTLRVDTGTYSENLTLGAARSGPKLHGAGAGKTLLDGGQAGPCLVLDAFTGGEISGLTLRNGKAAGAAWPAAHGGGVRCINGAAALLDRLALTGNTATYGAAVYSNNSAPELRNCVIWANRTTTAQGVLLFSGNRNPVLRNCTIANNLSNSGGVRAGAPCAPLIVNSILGGNGDELYNCAATFSCIEDGDAGSGNIALDPSFVNATGGDFHLNSGSPCINTAAPGSAPAVDLDGLPRDALPDIGACEYDS
jgi:hypothetical protein